MTAKVREQELALQAMREETDALRRAMPAREALQQQEGRLGDLERRLRGTEEDLQQTRRILAEERERRNRAISLIRPAGPQGEASSLSVAGVEKGWGL